MKADLEIALPRRVVREDRALPPTAQYCGVRAVGGRSVKITFNGNAGHPLIVRPDDGWLPVYGGAIFGAAISLAPVVPITEDGLGGW